MTDTTAIATTAPAKPPIIVLRERLEARKTELKSALMDIPADTFIRAVVTSAMINPDMQACTWNSIWLACLRACRDGLLPDGVEGAIVPYKDRATWIPMYQGLLRNFRRSGQFKWVTAGIVRQGEEFHHFIDETGEHFRHVPGDSFDTPIAKIYAMATTRDGGLFVTVLSLAEANKIKNMSRTTREDAPWKLWPEEMYKKTALRRLAKLLPTARDKIGGALADDDDDDELPDIASPAAVPASEIAPRESGAAAALKQFAGQEASGTAATETAPRAAADREGGGEQGRTAENLSASSSADSRDPAATATDPIAWAYGRGQEARRGGEKRTAPAEYRQQGHIKECDAWLAGYDGKPPPDKGSV